MDGLAQIFDPAGISAFFSHFRDNLHEPAFWLAVSKIIWIDILLSGDNALVIALACRGLPPQHRVWGMVFGAGAAVALRILFAGIIATLMGIPYLKLAGGLALLVIAAKLLVPDDEGEEVETASHLWGAVRIVVVADVVMSLDNVIAVAAAADGSIPLLIFGLIVSIPMIIAGAALIMALLDRLPFLVWAGAALLGWIAGEVIATDPAVHPILQRILGGHIALDIDAVSSVFGFAKQTRLVGEIGEVAVALATATIALVWGATWRRKRLAKNAVHVQGRDLTPGDELAP